MKGYVERKFKKSKYTQNQKKPNRVNEVEVINCLKFKKSRIESTKSKCSIAPNSKKAKQGQ